MSWTSSKSCSLSTDSLHYQCLSMLWTSSKNCSLSTASLRYQCLSMSWTSSKNWFPLNIFLTLSMSWTSSKNCSILTYTINVLDKLTELFPPNLHFQFLGQVHRLFPLNNFLDKFKELFSFNNFLTLSISWTHP